MAEWITDNYSWSDEFYSDFEPEDFLHLTDDELKIKTSLARTEKIKSIRRYTKPLSEKQRWCLAKWISDRENKDVYYS